MNLQCVLYRMLTINETTGASRKKWGDFGENEDYLKFFEKIVLLFGTLSV